MKTETIQALIDVQSKIGAIYKGESNPFFKSKYVPLPDILEQIKPILNQSGFLITQRPIIKDGQDVLITEIIHTSGDILSCEAPLKLEEKEKNNPQKYGSSVTYMRRYSLTALLGIAEIDDDGNQASGNNNQKKALQNIADEAYQEMKEMRDEANDQSCAEILKVIRNSGSLSEIEGAWQSKKKQINALKKYRPELYYEVLSAAKSEKARIGSQ